jgi:glycosyltransferase involved in cell wall biosynthesis
MRVVAETAYPAVAASPRVRISGFAPFLAAEGIDFSYLPTLTEREYAAVQADVWAGRKAAILARAGARLALRRKGGQDLRLVHRMRTLVPIPGLDPPRLIDVYDFDDALFLGSISPANARFGWVKREGSAWLSYVRRARLVLAGNAFLAQRASEYARRVEVVPSCVDPAIQPLRTHGAVDPVTVGWIGSPSTSGYLAAVLPALERINRDRTRAKLVLVGGGATLRAPWIEHRGWSRTTQADDLASFDVGIMPLPDDEWSRGKCGFKLLQYFSAGVPAIASPVGVAKTMVSAERGFLADSVDGWERALEALISDPGARREQGIAAREFVEREYSYQRWAPELAGLFRSLA